MNPPWKNAARAVARSLHGPNLWHDPTVGDCEDSERQGEMEASGSTGALVEEEARSLPFHLRAVRVAEDHQPHPAAPGPVHVLAPVHHAERQTVEVVFF